MLQRLLDGVAGGAVGATVSPCLRLLDVATPRFRSAAWRVDGVGLDDASVTASTPASRPHSRPGRRQRERRTPSTGRGCNVSKN